MKVNTLEEGEKYLKKSNYLAFMYFPSNYTKTMKIILNNNIEYDSKSIASAHFTDESE